MNNWDVPKYWTWGVGNRVTKPKRPNCKNRTGGIPLECLLKDLLPKTGIHRCMNISLIHLVNVRQAALQTWTAWCWIAQGCIGWSKDPWGFCAADLWKETGHRRLHQRWLFSSLAHTQIEEPSNNFRDFNSAQRQAYLLQEQFLHSCNFEHQA